MSTRPSQGSAGLGETPKFEQQPRSYGPFRLCLPVMLVLSGFLMLLFGVSWWTALIVVLLLACPAAIGAAIYSGLFQESAQRVCKPDRSG